MKNNKWVNGTLIFCVQVFVGLLVFISMLTGCQKYGRLSTVPQAAYIRAFNGIVLPGYANADTINQVQVNTWISFLVDPIVDANNNPMDAAMVGDFLGPMPDYFTPQETRPGQKATGAYTNSYNEDFPGVQPVLTAPVINGLDLSRWAQTPSGKHRVVVAFRAMNDVPFTSLLLSYRRPVIIDTTLDLVAGAVYTMEVVNGGVNDNKTYRLLVRRELFRDYNFSAGKVYLNIYNYSTDTTVVPESFDAYYCKYYDSAVLGGAYTATLTPETYLMTVRKRFATDVATDAPYYAIDATARDSFFYPNGNYRPLQKRPTIILRFYRVGENATGGKQPFFALTTGDDYYAGNSAAMAFNGHAEGRLMGPMEQTVTNDNQSNPYPLINSLELKVNPKGEPAGSMITVERFINLSGN